MSYTIIFFTESLCFLINSSNKSAELLKVQSLYLIKTQVSRIPLLYTIDVLSVGNANIQYCTLDEESKKGKANKINNKSKNSTSKYAHQAHF